MQPDPSEYEPREELYSEVWARFFLGPHSNCNGWTMQDGQTVCSCGTAMPATAKAAA